MGSLKLSLSWTTIRRNRDPLREARSEFETSVGATLFISQVSVRSGSCRRAGDCRGPRIAASLLAVAPAARPWLRLLRATFCASEQALVARRGQGHGAGASQESEEKNATLLSECIRQIKCGVGGDSTLASHQSVEPCTDLPYSPEPNAQ